MSFVFLLTYRIFALFPASLIEKPSFSDTSLPLLLQIFNTFIRFFPPSSPCIICLRLVFVQTLHSYWKSHATIFGKMVHIEISGEQFLSHEKERRLKTYQKSYAPLHDPYCGLTQCSNFFSQILLFQFTYLRHVFFFTSEFSHSAQRLASGAPFFCVSWRPLLGFLLHHNSTLPNRPQKS